MNLIKLVVQNSFAHKNTSIEFKDGLNVIVGKNGKGKSELLDMIAYALFGTSALRSSFKDYDKNLYVELMFSINNKRYVVQRDNKDALYELDVNDFATQLAVSKTAVSKKIVELLGYGLDVYNKINYSKQLESTSHSISTKSARMDLINKVNGIDEAVAVEKFYDEVRKDITSELKGLSLSSNPVTFQEDSKLESTDKNKVVEQVKETRVVIHRYESILDAYKSFSSFKGSLNDSSEIEAYFNTKLDKYLDNAYLPEEYIKHLNNYATVVRSKFNEINQITLEIQRDSVYSKETGELITLDEVEEIERILKNNHDFKAKSDLLSKGNLTCPHCREQFPLMYDALSAYNSVTELLDCKYTANEARLARMFINEARDKVLSKIETLNTLKESVSTYPDIKELNSYITDVTKQFHDMTNKMKELEIYLKFKQDFIDKYGEYTTSDIEDLKVRLDNKRKELEDLEQLYRDVTNYDATKAAYIKYQEAQDLLSTEIQNRIKLKESYEELIKISKDIKLDIQNTCIPILNRKASIVVTKLTDGVFHSLCLSETFELHLNDKPISVYAGSVQVIANIAFRIAIIEMFYKNRFPVFIGDEIDSFADNSRAETMHNILDELANEGYQVLLISHHPISVKANIIDLNNI